MELSTGNSSAVSSGRRDGVLLIDKPAGRSSAQVVQLVKRWSRASRAGHLGTLDPTATGLLPILLGEATKTARFLDSASKEYWSEVALGVETDTLDATGQVVRVAPVPRLDEPRLRAVVERFTGEFEQIPPVFSALKRGGVPLYRRARRGEEIASPPPRRVRVDSLRLEVAGPALLKMQVVCSPGTYVRALARDIGLALGTVAHLAQLRRVRSANFCVDDAYTLAKLLEMGWEQVRLISVREALAGLAEIRVDDGAARRIRNGDAGTLLRLAPSALRGGQPFKVIEGETVLAIACVGSDGAQILRVFAPGTL